MSGAATASDADAYLLEYTAPVGSTLYYSTRFVPAAQARRSIAIEAFRRELDKTLEECHEVAVATARLGWWHEELRRFVSGDAQHPVTRVLAEVMTQRGIAATRLAAAVAATIEASSRQSWSDDEGLHGYCLATGGELAALDCADAAQAGRVRTLGALLCAHDMLAGLFRHPRRGCRVFTASRLARAGIEAAALFATPVAAPADDLLRERALELRTRLEAELDGWHPGNDAALVLATRARIASATLAAIGARGSEWLARHASVSPLRALWIGWRTSRRR